MKQEKQQKTLETLAKSGITVAGDLVLEKNVEYEVNNVEKGGIGIQIINGSKETSQTVSDREIKSALEMQEGAKYDDEGVLPSAEEMVSACEKTKEEGLWWGNASWSVTFRIYCILGYKGNEESFINLVEGWPFKQPFKYVCNRNALDRPLRRGRINGPLDKWAAEGASKREVKLGERLMAILRPRTEDRG